MVYLKAVLLAIVEGVTEFLPISSTGHLILVDSVLKLTPDQSFNNTFLIVIQLPAIFSVVVYFRNDLWPFPKDGRLRAQRGVLWTKIFIAVLPAIAFGALLDDFFERNFFAPGPVTLALFLGGIVLILVERLQYTRKYETVHDVTWLGALGIGLFQCLAMFPGTSRSGATIIGAMLLGASRPAAAEFSFFLAIPTMIAATAWALLNSGFAFSAEEWLIIAVGSVTSFLVAYAAIAAFMNYIRRHSFALFGYYRIVLAGLVLVAFLFGWVNAN